MMDFEAWFLRVQKEHGMEGVGLMRVERAIVLAYIKWLQEPEPEVAHAADQAK